MKKNVSMFLALAMSVAMLTGCGDSHDHEEEVKGEQVGEEVTASHYPVTINNFNQSVVYDAKPENVLALNLNTAEIIVELGAVDSLMGLAVGNFHLDNVNSENYNAMSKIAQPDEINSGIPTLEGVISLSPDLMIANSYYFNVPVFGTLEDYKANGVEFFIPEGSYEVNATIENTYLDIANLGKMFENTEKADEIINDMKSRVNTVQNIVANETPVTVCVIDNVKEDGSFGVAGGIGLVNNLIELAGGENIFSDVDSQFSTISVEELIARNPAVIIFSDYGARPTDVEDNTDYIMNTVEFSGVDAIVGGRIGSIDLYKTFPSMQNAEAVELIASFLYPDLFN